MFSVRFRRRRHRNNFCFSRQNRLSFNLDIWDKEIISLGKCTGWHFGDPDPRSRLWHWKKKFACLQDKVRTTQPITTKLGSNISLVMPITWLYLEEFCWKLFFCQIFLENFGCVFSRSNIIGHISGMVGPIDVKRKGSASVGYRVNHVTLTFDLTHDLDLFKVKVSNSLIWGMRGGGGGVGGGWGGVADWHGTKGMWVDHSRPWPWPMGNHGGVGGCTV